ncbi:unnamed protein product [Paramecium sonneborni]|uniref:Transmembrane protein n=1 Tax=Paramecium sonneborni TaxID=65129 RepID=A0A8S1MK16_9CILI|nr:unnamed protein product [Paramecium sonneborni]
MKQNLQIDKQEQSSSSENYDFVETPPDIIKAKQHGKAFRIHKNYNINSPKCNCCNSHVVHTQYNIFCDLSEFKENRQAYLYLLQIKQFMFLLLIPCIILLPYSLYFSQKGDQCENLQICGKTFWKRYSIWNQISDYFQLDDFLLQVLYSLTIFLSSLTVYFMDFGSIYKPFLSQQLQLAFLKQSIMIVSTFEDYSQIENKHENIQYFKLYNMDLFKDQIMQQLLINQTEGTITNYKRKLIKTIFSQQIDLNLICQGNIIIFQSQIQKDEFCSQNEDKIINEGIEQNFSPTLKKKCNCSFILQFIFIILLPLITTTLLALNLYIQYQYLKSYPNLSNKFLMRILFSILSLSEIHLSNYIAQQLISQNYQIQIYFMLQVISLKNFNKLLSGISNQEIFLKENGIIDTLILISFLNVILPSLSIIFDIDYFVKQFKKMYKFRNNNNNLLQIEANKLFEARSINFQSKQQNIFQLCLLAQIFIFDFPFILPLTLLSLFITYWVHKYIFVKKCIPKLNKWEDDKNLEIQKQQFLFLLIMYCIQNFILFNIYLLVSILVYLIGFKIFNRIKLDKTLQNQKEINPIKLYNYIQQYNPVNFFGDDKHIKHQYLYELFIVMNKQVKKNSKTQNKQKVQSKEINENLIQDI